MNNYEIVYIIHPALQEGRLIDIKNKIHEQIITSKGKVLFDDNWGKKKLAYAIDKQKYGTYLFCQFLLEGKNVQSINVDCELNTNILRHLITKIESSQVLDEKDKKEVKKVVTKEVNEKSSENIKSDSNELGAKGKTDSKAEVAQAADSKEEAEKVADSKEEVAEAADSKEEAEEAADSKEEAEKVADSKEEAEEAADSKEEEVEDIPDSKEVESDEAVDLENENSK